MKYLNENQFILNLYVLEPFLQNFYNIKKVCGRVIRLSYYFPDGLAGKITAQNRYENK